MQGPREQGLCVALKDPKGPGTQGAEQQCPCPHRRSAVLSLWGRGSSGSRPGVRRVLPREPLREKYAGPESDPPPLKQILGFLQNLGSFPQIFFILP